MRILLLLLLVACSMPIADIVAAEPIHVLVWDERHPRQSQAYSNFLGNEIAARLKKYITDGYREPRSQKDDGKYTGKGKK